MDAFEAHRACDELVNGNEICVCIHKTMTNYVSQSTLARQLDHLLLMQDICSRVTVLERIINWTARESIERSIRK